MRAATFFIVFYLLSSCGQEKSNKEHVPNPEAEKLFKQARALTSLSFHDFVDSIDYVKAVGLLDSAIAIDSNYFSSYILMLQCQSALKQYDRALQTAHKMERIKPQGHAFYSEVATVYELMGDTVTSKEYFRKAFVYTSGILDTMSRSNFLYPWIVINKGTFLVMSGQQEKGNKILKQLYTAETDTSMKTAIAMFIGKTRQEIFEVLCHNKSDRNKK